MRDDDRHRLTPEELLLKRRLVFVRGTLDDKAAGDAAAQLMTLDADGDDPIALVLDAAGTSLGAAFTLMDVVDLLGVPVHVTVMGRVEGPAVGVLAVAPRRLIAPHATVRLRDPDFSAAGGSRQLENWLDHHADALRRFHKRLAEATGQTIAAVEADCAAGRFLDAEQAVAYGLADEIARRGAA